MNFERLKRRVERNEQLVEARMTQTREAYDGMRTQWREAWTPTRILMAGLVSGFIAGSAQPKQALRRLGRVGKTLANPRWLQLVGSLSGLLTSAQALVAAMTARHAAETAEAAAEEVADTAAGAGPDDTGPAGGMPGDARTARADAGATAAGTASAEPEAVPPTDRRKPDQRWDTQPAAAEAATEISER